MLYGYEDHERELNIGRRLILAELYNSGCIKRDVLDDYTHNYAIISKKPSFFSQFWKKFYKKDEDHYILIKQKSLIIPDGDEPNDKKADLTIVHFDKSKKEE